ncbi:MAG: FAD-binding oxidoreductase [Phycisphaerae bacterium]
MTASTNTLLTRVNDVHSALNSTQVRLLQPTSAQDVIAAVTLAVGSGCPIAVSGGRHAMGGQQFLSESFLLDMRGLNRILDLDTQRGLVRAEAGIQWPELIDGILRIQRDRAPAQRPYWGIRQKQTGANALTLGGALAANVHGRGLLMAPIVSDVESFVLVDAQARTLHCSRDENANLFALAIGGYGLFGVLTEVTLRLSARQNLRRVVRVVDIEEAVPAARRRIGEGFVYGDFQFDIDPRSPDFLTKGVYAGYVPVAEEPPPPETQLALSREDWMNLLTLAHTDKARAFTRYAQHYLATDGQLYHSDTHQLAEYIDDYHGELDRRIGAACPGSEIISELYVPPDRLIEFLRAAARLLIECQTPVIYGTIRLINPDEETVLAWAKSRYACIIFNLHVDHNAASMERTAMAFRGLIDLASGMGGSYYLTYHRFATVEQLERCYPRIREFFEAKRQFDPDELFQSDWYRHYRDLLN